MTKNKYDLCKCGKLKYKYAKICRTCYFETLKGSGNPMFGTHRIGENGTNYKGINADQFYCIDCKKIKISRSNFYYGDRRCLSCARIYQYATRPETIPIGLKGKNSPHYIHGHGCDEYPTEFNEKLKESIRTRDNHKCQNCDKNELEQLKELNRKLSVHHIDYNRDNCKEENLITLCLTCHANTNKNRDYYYALFTYIINQLNGLLQ